MLWIPRIRTNQSRNWRYDGFCKNVISRTINQIKLWVARLEDLRNKQQCQVRRVVERQIERLRGRFGLSWPTCCRSLLLWRAASWNDIESDKAFPVRPLGWTNCAVLVYRRYGVWLSYALTRSKFPAAQLDYASNPVQFREKISYRLTWICHLGFDYCCRLYTSSKN